MKTSTHFVTDRNAYRGICARASEVFRLEQRLPEQVFVKGLAKFRFIEFDLMMASGFWNVLAACATQFGDTDISMIVHDPEPEAYYFSNFQRYGAFSFERNSSGSDYYQTLFASPQASSADAMLHVANVISWCGSSRSWGFWGERKWGIGLAATSRADISWPVAKGIEWLGPQEALSELVALNFSNRTVPESFTTRLLDNFN